MNEKTAGEVYKKNISSVVYVSTRGGQGSGVVVGDNEVVTNCHVIDDGGPIEVLQPPVNGVGDPKRSSAKIIAASARDLCLLKTDDLPVSAAMLGESMSVDVGDPVYAIGNPAAVYGTLSSGIVSQVHPNFVNAGELAGVEIQTTAAISRGSSGGGLFDRKGRLVGIPYRSLDRGESLHMALPVELVEYLRQRSKVEAQLRAELAHVFASPNSRALFGVATGIADAIPDGIKLIEAWSDVGQIAALSGVRDFAEESVKRLTVLSKAAARTEERDEALGGLADVWACMDEIDRALELSGQVENEDRKNKVIASVVQEQARMEKPRGAPNSRSREIYRRLPPVESVEDPNLLSMMALAKAEMRDSEDALDIARKIPKAHPLFLSTVAEIAAALQQQETYIGADALFLFAVKFAAKNEWAFLAEIALIAAKSGNIPMTDFALATLSKKEEEWKAVSDYADYADYDHKMLIFGGRAETAALTAAQAEDISDSLGWMRRIPVLGTDLVNALVRTAIALRKLGG